ncbi:hypothetical protein GCM10023331_00770 [Algivirga pacifica]|uniref:CBM20 domain-containing protein n=1 Tax=Algivirga pacifica TaxID=1162670 RepID=A0ABP9CW96_9BACT
MVVVEELPENTPAESRLFVSGNFNYWDPGDTRFEMKKTEEGKYYYELPYGAGNVLYKITRGDWTSVEAGLCGGAIANRSVGYGEGDTVFIAIESWEDKGPTNCPQVTIQLEDLPPTHEPGEAIYIAGDFNAWDPGNDDFRLAQDENGKYAITLNKPDFGDEIQFKFTRGNWETVEVDTYGKPTSNHFFHFGFVDTLGMAVLNWKDRMQEEHVRVTFCVEEYPKYTPVSSNLFVASNLNNWDPMNGKFRMESQKDGTYTLDVYQKKGTFMEYKITRGGWSKVEKGEGLEEIPNRQVVFEKNDTLYLQVESWMDQDFLKQYLQLE